jgi:DNA adenine methylase
MSENIKITPFIKWAWWKRKLSKTILSEFPENYNNYFEPFLWWGAIFFTIQKSNSCLSDINEELVNVYNVIKNNPIELLTELKTYKNTLDFYMEIRWWDRNKKYQEDYSHIQKAARFIFLNKTCFNWLYRVNSKWQNNVSFWRYKSPDFIQEDLILEISKMFNDKNINIKSHSYKDILKDIQKWDLIYLDPPYDSFDNKKWFVAYDKDWFTRLEQLELSNFCREIHKKWAYFILSNNNTQYIKSIYQDFNIKEIEVMRLISGKWESRWKVWEVIIKNF